MIRFNPFSRIGLVGVLLTVAVHATAQSHMYLDFNGADPGSDVHPGGTGFLWSSAVADFWSTSAAGTAQTQVWLDNRIAVIAAGTDCEGFGPGASLDSGSSAPLVGGVRVEDCPFRISQNTLF